MAILNHLRHTRPHGRDARSRAARRDRARSGPRMGTVPSFPESQFSASCSCAQIEDHHSIVLENAAISRAQMMVKCLVVLQPPECRPNESNESRFRVAQSLKFANRRRIIGRWPEVVPILLDKRDCAAIRAKRIAAE